MGFGLQLKFRAFKRGVAGRVRLGIPSCCKEALNKKRLVEPHDPMCSMSEE